MFHQIIELLKSIIKNILTILSLPFVRPGVARHGPSFERWQKHGVHVLAVHFYSPVPDTRELRKNYPQPTDMVGIDMNESSQVELIKDFCKYQDEYNAFKTLNNPTKKEVENANTFILSKYMYDGIDPHVYYSIIRLFKPKKVLEIGAGHSTRVSRMATDKNGDGQITCIEPYPEPFLLRIPNIEVIQKKVQEVDLSLFTALQPNDILFIDSSHTVRIGGDVTFLMLEVLPRLSPGVIVHFHDIFLPEPLPRDWVLNRHRFWMEQYLLQAYLIGNKQVKVLFANNHMCVKHPELIRDSFPKALDFKGASFWIQTLE